MNATEYEARKKKLERQSAIAQAMMQPALAGGPQGQMVSGRYVAPSPVASLASLLGAGIGAYRGKKLEDQTTALDTERGADITKAIEAYTAAAPTDKPAALGNLANSTMNPADYAKLLVAGAMKPTASGAPVAVVGPDGKPHYVSRQDAIGATPYSPEQPPVPILGPDGKPILATREDAIGKTPYDKPAPSTNVTLNTDKSLYGTLADQQAKSYADLYSQAQASPERIDRAARVQALLKSVPITGTAAEYKLGVAKALKSAGLYDSEDIANTELLGRELAGSTLEAIKSSGLGAGSGFSNADREFLEKVTGGNINLDAKTLQRIAELNMRSARATIKRWNDTAGRLDQAQLKTLGMTPIDMPPEMQQQSGQPNGIQDLINDPRYSGFFKQ